MKELLNRIANGEEFVAIKINGVCFLRLGNDEEYVIDQHTFLTIMEMETPA